MIILFISLFENTCAKPIVFLTDLIVMHLCRVCGFCEDAVAHGLVRFEKGSNHRISIFCVVIYKNWISCKGSKQMVGMVVELTTITTI